MGRRKTWVMPPRVLTESVRIPMPDGSLMTGYLARPDAGAADRPEGELPGVLVGMELFGVTAHVRDVCDRLAELGYVALAPDLYHRLEPGIELPADARGRARGFELLHQLTRPGVLEDVAAARDYLGSRSGALAGMVGLSVGGHLAYLAATAMDLPVAVVAYGGWIPGHELPLSRPVSTLSGTPGITGRVVFLVGDDDPLIPPAERGLLVEALTSAGVDHELIAYPGVGHGFLCDRRAGFDPVAATSAWLLIDQALSRKPVLG